MPSIGTLEASYLSRFVTFLSSLWFYHDARFQAHQQINKQVLVTLDWMQVKGEGLQIFSGECELL